MLPFKRQHLGKVAGRQQGSKTTHNDAADAALGVISRHEDCLLWPCQHIWAMLAVLRCMQLQQCMQQCCVCRRLYLAYIWVACDVLDEDVLGNAAVIGCIARFDVNGRVQDGHPALPVLVQLRHKGLRTRHISTSGRLKLALPRNTPQYYALTTDQRHEILRASVWLTMLHKPEVGIHKVLRMASMSVLKLNASSACCNH